MTIDCLDSIADIVADELDDDDFKSLLKTPLWNGREMHYLTRCLEHSFLRAYINSLANQAEFQEIDEDERTYELMDLSDEEVSFESAYEVYSATQDQFDIDHNISGKHDVHGVLKTIKESAKKVAKSAAKTAKKVAKYVKEHKKEILITVAAIAVAAVAAAIVVPLISDYAATAAYKAVNAAVCAFVAANAPKYDHRASKDPIISGSPQKDDANVTNTIAHSENQSSSTTDLALDSHEETNSSLTYPINLQTELAAAIKNPPPKISIPTTIDEILLNNHQNIPEAHLSAIPSDLAYQFKSNYVDPLPPIDVSSLFYSTWGAIKTGLNTIGNSVLLSDFQDPAMPVDLFMSNAEIRRLQSYQVDPSPAAFQTTWSIIKSGLDTIGNSIKGSWQADLNAAVSATGSALWKTGLLSPKIGDFIKNDIDFAHTSHCYYTEGVSKDGMEIGFGNGIDNKFEDALNSANHIRSIANTDLRIEGVYNKSHTAGIDLLEAVLVNFNGYSPITQNLFMNKWTNFHLKNLDKPHAKFLQYCHSQVAIHVCNALLRLPKEIRDRVIVVAIAPAMVVPEEWCYQSFNYASDRDKIHYAQDAIAYIKACMSPLRASEIIEVLNKSKSQLIILEAHDDNPTFLDHEFISSTYFEVIKDHIDDYINKNGEYQ